MKSAASAFMEKTVADPACKFGDGEGKSAPSVDRKLANAWLGFYVALTRNEALPNSAATTEIATEASLSEVASSHGAVSPRRIVDDESEALAAHEVDEFTDDEDVEEQSPTKRTRRSRRRRRTRGRGKRNAARRSEATPGGDEGNFCLPEDGALDGDNPSTMLGSSFAPTSADSCNAIISTSPTPSTPVEKPPAQWPFHSPQSYDSCPRAYLRTETLPASFSQAYSSPAGLVSTSPKASQTPTHREASQRTPPRSRMTPCSSPVAQFTFGSPVNFGLQEHQTAHLGIGQAGSTLFAASSPLGVRQGLALAQVSTPKDIVQCPPHHTASTPVDTWRSWLAGGFPSSGEALAKHLQEAVPEVYED